MPFRFCRLSLESVERILAKVVIAAGILSCIGLFVILGVVVICFLTLVPPSL